MMSEEETICVLHTGELTDKDKRAIERFKQMAKKRAKCKNHQYHKIECEYCHTPRGVLAEEIPF